MKEQVCCWECGKALVELNKSNKDWRIFCTHDCLMSYKHGIVEQTL